MFDLLKRREDMRVYRKRWNLAHPESVRASKASWKERNPHYFSKRNAVGQAYIDSLKAGGCVDCDNKNLSVLDFDHVNGKTHLVSDLTYLALHKIDIEVAKCEVRCANCHRIKTRERRRGV